ncbi:PilZ domain-containing protein [Bosea sp. OAE752]|uniref:PilZ domain-containing protein n=1 Tax=Bosea sp. OAE752 TaxID=2663873 RepID=UPI003D224413
MIMSDRSNRAAERQRRVQPAKLKGASGAIFSCMIRDISVGGAMLRVPVGFNEKGGVHITSQAIGVDREARIVWQDRSSIGIAFRSVDLANAPPAEATPHRTARTGWCRESSISGAG